jgi:hypothetical protein
MPPLCSGHAGIGETGNPKRRKMIESAEFILRRVRSNETFQVSQNPCLAMKELLDAWRRVDRNKLAGALSLIPGLGHLYKHHYLAGFGILTVGNVLIGFIATLMALGTLGLSMIFVPAAWIAGVGYSAYMASDEHGHHPWLHVWNYHWADFFSRSGKA